MTCNITQADLSQFIGSVEYYRHPLIRSCLLTDCAQYLTDNGAAWLIDAIVSYQLEHPCRSTEFQHWRLTVNEANEAQLTCGDGNGKNIITQLISYTDFPLSHVDLYLVRETIQGVDRQILMLASEY